MTTQVKWSLNPLKQGQSSIEFLSKSAIDKARNFHKSLPGYKETPLRSLDNLAKYLGVAKVCVKDESYRFGLNAFKVLGGSYAIGCYLASLLNKDIGELPFSVLTSPEVHRMLGDITFTTATDGNHGRGVAWTANKLQQKSVIYMPKGSAKSRLENIQSEGAKASITDVNYDEVVRLVAEDAKRHGWVMIQDTAWEGYEDIPTWIMQGYGTMAAEALEQMLISKGEPPTHIFIQAGVGSLAGAVQGYFASVLKEACPRVVIVESNQANCLFQSVQAGDGKPHFVTGELNTIMAGLACGEPNTISWEVLRDYSDMFISCPDIVAALGMRMLGNPLGNDSPIISGESGAVTLGLFALLMQDEQLLAVKQQLHLDENSRVLLFSTEGDTDPAQYRNIVWQGEFSYK
ncbi:diaminopropionate ammonia-lyase [Pelorhabdus rhamnosifermentans]|uniref:diaminopropionate ammonia-lyase n=1 Tax=Pelorhabdus rhamnosifermentans TaxID=2772457 RepID=UPI001C0617D0|nr:diaminopropionate ammonia-lyase [Pelorhabdus rhamnosifermentans]